MNFSRILLALLVSCIPLTASAAVSSGDLPGNTVWYMHADLKQMRTSEAGTPIYDWFDDEVIVEINDELGIDINDEFDSVTAFSDEQDGTVIVVDGKLSEALRDEMMAKVRVEVDFEDRSHGKLKYYFAGDEENNRDSDRDPFDDFEDALYFSFAVKNKLIVTSHEDQMKELLDSGGSITGSGSVDSSMFVLTADKSFVQAGLRPDGLADDEDGGWESNIIRNTEQATLLISDSDGQVAVEAQLMSTDPAMARSIGGIVNGLISLQAFSTDMEPELQSLLQNTKVTVNENLLTISTVVDPELVVSIVED